MPTRGVFHLVLLLVLAGPSACIAALQEAQPGSCHPLEDASGTITLQADCTWSAPVVTNSKRGIRVAATRQRLEEAGTVAVFAGPDTGSSPSITEQLPGFTLHLERVVVVGFTYAAPGAAEPLLWPRGLLQQAGSTLNMTDVRLVTNDQAVFTSWLQFFRTDRSLMYWTDNATFVHIHEWTDGHTTLKSVGLLMQAPAQLSNPLQLPPPLVKNCLVTATNSTLVPSLIANAAAVTPQPLLVYITTNVSIGAFPSLPATGVPINRPVVFVGLQSLVTSIDFQMVVNQLNATGSQYSNVTFVGLALENLAPGDATTSTVAAPFSIAISNNVWAVFYNRTAANDTRLAYLNVTLVLPQEPEMAYITYMFTLFTSSLPYLRQQTSLYSDVLHISILQYQPGPGVKAVTVSRMMSWYHWWNDVVLTTERVVAQRMPIPQRPVTTLTTTRPSPLVQAVHNVQDLKVAAANEVIGNRQHILLLLDNISVAELSSNGNSSSPISLKSVITWVGSTPTQQAAQMWAEEPAAQQAATQPQDLSSSIAVSFGYARSAVVVMSPAPDDALQLQQLLLRQLPQGPGVTAADASKGPYSRELWTLLLWSVERPMTGKPLSLDGVQLQLPGPELQYLQVAAQRSTDFVAELEGDNSAALTFQDVSCLGHDCESVRVGSFQGPGMVATNLTLSLDPAAASAIPGYVWPAFSEPPTITRNGGMAPWAAAVVAVCVVVTALVAAVGGFLVWRHRRDAARSKDLMDPFSKLEAGSSPPCSCRAHSDSSHTMGQKSGRSSRQSSHVCPVHGANCEVCSALDRASRGTNNSFSETNLAAKLQGSPLIVPQLGTTADQSAAGVVVPVANMNYAVKKMEQRQEGAGEQQQYQQEIDVLALRDSPVPVHVTETFADSVAAGMQRWRAAVSSTTMLLMERRMDAALPVGSSGAGSTNSYGRQPGNSCIIPEEHSAEFTEAPKAQNGSQPAGTACGLSVSLLNSTPPQLQLLELLGQGSFGCVYLATWRGKRVAVKIMQLPANALLGPAEQNLLLASELPADPEGQADAQQERQRQKVAHQKQQNSPPHMAIMEAVLSSIMSHPNVVQVYTYILNPLTSGTVACNGKAGGSNAAEGAGQKGSDNIAGWELKIIMEYCNEGSLRDALDCGLLGKAGSFLAPSAVLNLAHDVAAAMLHLHSEGIVHGDLKAGNVMLTGSGLGNGDDSRVWSAAGSRHLTAKVADFGLAMPLGASDTHATLMARGTPTHMSPELFLSGHVSKASDVYAYGILLYEVITGQRAYAGVPIPLLPHEVARQGLRPTWPADMPPGCRDLKLLAEACWAHKPQDRPTFSDILAALDCWASGGIGWPAVPRTRSLNSTCNQNSPCGSCSAEPAIQQQQQQQGTLELQQSQDLQGPQRSSPRTPRGRDSGGLLPIVDSSSSCEQQRLQQTESQQLQPPAESEPQQQQLQVPQRQPSNGNEGQQSQQVTFRRQPSTGGQGGGVGPLSPGGLVVRQSSGQGDRARNVNMSWSEVDCGIR